MNMNQQTQNYTINQLDSIAQKLYDMRSQCRIYTFTGDLGAGKTTLIKALLKKWGVAEHVTSPTFNYVNQYVVNGVQLYHFDLYRLDSLEEFTALGFDEYLYQSDSFVFIEWPSIIDSLLTHEVCHIHIDHVSEDKRTVTISC